ncbi:MAG TPA: substrate-binding domain-containing protein, partial [Spirochaetia bacterium]|nr:substrate-binding domain-containing protein [Spirochaetia bacterium]
SALRRAEGYRNALHRAGIPYRDDWVQNGEFLPLEARDALDRILALPGDKPTAYFCANDTMALSVIHHLQERGIRVPQDISVVGVDDSEAASRSVPALTTFRQDMFALARQAAELFIDKIEGKGGDDPAKVRVPMAFVERGSCARVSA